MIDEWLLGCNNELNENVPQHARMEVIHMATKTTKTVKAEFEFDRETKGTYRFAEVVNGQTDSPDTKIRTLYLKKSTVQELGYEIGDTLTVLLKVFKA